MSAITDVLHVVAVTAARPYIGSAGAEALGNVLTATGQAVKNTQSPSTSTGKSGNRRV